MTSPDDAVFWAARKAGCSHAEAEALSLYAASETLEDAAKQLHVTPRTLAGRIASARRRLNAAHNVALMALVMRQAAISEIPLRQ